MHHSSQYPTQFQRDDYDLEDNNNDTTGVIIDTNGGENLREVVQLKLLNWYYNT